MATISIKRRHKLPQPKARAAAKTTGRSRRNPFPTPEASRGAGEGIQKIREASRKELADTEKRDAGDG